MAEFDDVSSAVPANVITGFLGVGKTTAILELLAKKPADERWAVLVNEFGEIGVDGSLFRGRAGEASEVYIEEVPGGCMCCVSGLPMQIALGRLMSRARPHRLLIEPTGLGHPVEVLETLSKDHNREFLSLGRTLTLVDARQLSDKRYTSHTTFLQQLRIADVVVANKADLYGPEDRDALARFIGTHGHPEAELLVTERGRIEPSCLEGAPLRTYEPGWDRHAQDGSHAHEHSHAAEHERAHDHGRSGSDGDAIVLASDLAFPDSGVVSATNQGEGFHSVGWRFSPEKLFDRSRLDAFIRGLVAERVKGVFITEQGVFGYNLTPDAMTETALDDCIESRIEIIANIADERWEAQLMACLS